MRKCFMSDNDGHWYAVDIDKKGFFNNLIDDMGHYDYDDAAEIYDQFEDEFGTDCLNMHISNYSFEDLREETD